jgi:hypothetical protein
MVEHRIVGPDIRQPESQSSGLRLLEYLTMPRSRRRVSGRAIADPCRAPLASKASREAGGVQRLGGSPDFDRQRQQALNERIFRGGKTEDTPIRL